MEQIVFTEKRDLHIKLLSVEFPNDSVHGATIANDNKPDDYKVVLNDLLDEKQKVLTFLHEALHIYHNDFADPSRPVAEIEAERKAELRELLQLAIKEDEEQKNDHARIS